MTQNKKIKPLLLSIIGITILGLSFSLAYMIMDKTHNILDVEVSLADVQVTFTDCTTDCNSISGTLTPGGTPLVKTFSITNTGTREAKVPLYLVVMKNEFLNNELKYKLENTSSNTVLLDNENVAFNDTSEVVFQRMHDTIVSEDIKVTIPVGGTVNFRLTFTFIETGENQDYNLGKRFNVMINTEEKYTQPTYSGTTLNRAKLTTFVNNNSPTRLILTDIGGHAEGTDVGTATGHIYAWMDGTTAYVTAKEAGYKLKPSDASYFFDAESTNCKYRTVQYMDVGLLDVSASTSLLYCFFMVGYNTSSFEIVGLENWDVSSVTNMASMFYSAGYSATSWSIGDISNWDVSKVTNMRSMFDEAGCNATTFEFDLSNWDVSKVKLMESMFVGAGRYSTTFSLNLSGWNVSNVTTMWKCFTVAGYSATNFSLDLSNWNVTKTTNTMEGMFTSTAYNVSTFELDLSGWDVSGVTNMQNMFDSTGYRATTFTLNLSDWDMASAANLSGMFTNAGYRATGTNWKVLIPLQTGTTNNTTARLYGLGSSYASSASGKTFTLSGHHYELLSAIPSTCTAHGQEIYGCSGGNGCTLNHTDTVEKTKELVLSSHTLDSNDRCTICNRDFSALQLQYKNRVVTESSMVNFYVSNTDYEYNNASLSPNYAKIITIVAPTTGKYQIVLDSSNTTYMRLYDSNMEAVDYSFSTLQISLTADQVYYLAVGMRTSSSTSYKITTTITMPS